MEIGSLREESPIEHGTPYWHRFRKGIRHDFGGDQGVESSV